MADRISEHPHLPSVRVNDVVNLTRAMTAQLRLNEGQYLKLLALNRTKLESLSSLAREYRTDHATLAAKTAELQAQYEQACSQVLTPSQLSQL